MTFPPFVIGRVMEGDELFRYRCSLLGIRDPELVRRAKEEEARRGNQ